MGTRNGKRTKVVIAVALVSISAGCSMRQEETSSSTVQHRFSQPPQAAGACFARNAERRSSALVAEVSPPDARGRVAVVVNVKNGVEYAKLALRPVGTGSDGSISLNVVSRRGTDELVGSLVAGC